MNKKELIEEAKRRYPIGCKFQSTYEKGYVNEVMNHRFYFTGDNIQNSGSGWVFSKPDKWAKIVSYPSGFIPITENVLNNIEIY